MNRNKAVFSPLSKKTSEFVKKKPLMYEKPWRTGITQRRHISSPGATQKVTKLQKLRNEFKTMIMKSSMRAGTRTIKDKARMNTINNFVI